jgi:hypothetical protein
MINNILKKRHDKALCKLVKNTHNAKYSEYFMDDDFIFSDDHKPHCWFW